MSSRRVAVVAAVLLAASQVGCATVISGRYQRATFTSSPSGAEVVVLGGVAGEYVLDAKAHSDRFQLALALVKKVAPASWAPGLEQLERLSVDELAPKLLFWLRFDAVPRELASLGPVGLSSLTKLAVEEVLGLGPSGTTPFSGELHRGTRHAVMARRVGHRSTIAGTEESFNWVFLLNILNGFLLSPIDIVSGAWFDVTPTSIALTLEPTDRREPARRSPEPVAPPPADAPPPEEDELARPSPTGRTSGPRRR